MLRRMERTIARQSVARSCSAGSRLPSGVLTWKNANALRASRGTLRGQRPLAEQRGGNPTRPAREEQRAFGGHPPQIQREKFCM
jgi:hypothetical protein